ncbi:hypothetical protein [Saccharopolyspora taberi]|uniref:hypothetical protein n=1 Tax=Saccharopolyspora taberi TaxID=60895 RepID=UPI0031D5EE92
MTPHRVTPPRIIGYAVVAFASVLAVGAAGPGLSQSEPEYSAASYPEPGVPFQAEALVPSPPRQTPGAGPQLPVVSPSEVPSTTSRPTPTRTSEAAKRTSSAKPEVPATTSRPSETTQPAESTRPSEPVPPTETAPPTGSNPPSETAPPTETAPPSESEPPSEPPPSSEEPEPTRPGLLPAVGGAVRDLLGS